jgi:predicted nucleic acid-binding protein
MAPGASDSSSSPRLFLDTTILVKAASFPRLPFEVVRLGLRHEVRVVLSQPVVESARVHVSRAYPDQRGFLELLLHRLAYEEVPAPHPSRLDFFGDLCRDKDDVPIAVAAIDAGMDFLVTTDRDLTVVDATTARLRQLVTVITPLALLRHVLHWPEPRIGAAIHRTWQEVTAPEWQELRGQ